MLQYLLSLQSFITGSMSKKGSFSFRKAAAFARCMRILMLLKGEKC